MRSNDCGSISISRARSDSVMDSVREVGRERAACTLDGSRVRVEGEHGRRIGRDADGQASIAAAELQDPPVAEIAKPAQRGDVRALGIEHATHAAAALYASLRRPSALTGLWIVTFSS